MYCQTERGNHPLQLQRNSGVGDEHQHVHAYLQRNGSDDIVADQQQPANGDYVNYVSTSPRQLARAPDCGGDTVRAGLLFFLACLSVQAAQYVAWGRNTSTNKCVALISSTGTSWTDNSSTAFPSSDCNQPSGVDSNMSAATDGAGTWLGTVNTGTAANATIWYTGSYNGAWSTTTVAGFSVKKAFACYGNGDWLLVESDGLGTAYAYATSPGGSWSTGTVGTLSFTAGCAYLGGQFVAWGNAGIMVSSNLAGSWSAKSSPDGSAVSPVAYDSGSGLYAALVGTNYKNFYTSPTMNSSSWTSYSPTPCLAVGCGGSGPWSAGGISSGLSLWELSNYVAVAGPGIVSSSPTSSSKFHPSELSPTAMRPPAHRRTTVRRIVSLSEPTRHRLRHLWRTARTERPGALPTRTRIW